MFSCYQTFTQINFLCPFFLKFLSSFFTTSSTSHWKNETQTRYDDYTTKSLLIVPEVKTNNRKLTKKTNGQRNSFFPDSTFNWYRTVMIMDNPCKRNKTKK